MKQPEYRREEIQGRKNKRRNRGNTGNEETRMRGNEERGKTGGIKYL